MSSDPLVSIIIPTYNCRRWLGEAIDSALKQTYPHCEIIVVDDGSTDGTGEWVQAQHGDRVRYHWQPNGGVARARNTGLSLARGDYIQLLDADDRIAANKVASQVRFLEEHPEVAVVYCHTLLFDADDPSQTWDYEGRSRYQSGDILAPMVDDGFIFTMATLVRRSWMERVAPFDEELPSNEDWDFWLRMAHAGARFHYLPGSPLALYRAHNTSRSSRHVEHGWSGIMVLQKLEQAIADPDERERLGIRRAICCWRFRYGKALAENAQLRRGLWQMTRGILADRRDLDYKLTFMACCVLVGPAQASETLMQLKRRKDRVVARLLRRLEGAR